VVYWIGAQRFKGKISPLQASKKSKQGKPGLSLIEIQENSQKLLTGINLHTSYALYLDHTNYFILANQYLHSLQVLRLIILSLASLKGLQSIFMH